MFEIRSNISEKSKRKCLTSIFGRLHDESQIKMIRFAFTFFYSLRKNHLISSDRKLKQKFQFYDSKNEHFIHIIMTCYRYHSILHSSPANVYFLCSQWAHERTNDRAHIKTVNYLVCVVRATYFRPWVFLFFLHTLWRFVIFFNSYSTFPLNVCIFSFAVFVFVLLLIFAVVG